MAYRLQIAGSKAPLNLGPDYEMKSDAPLEWPENKQDLNFWIEKAKKYGFGLCLQDGELLIYAQPNSTFGQLIPVKEVEPGVWRELTQEELETEEYNGLEAAKAWYAVPESDPEEDAEEA